MQGFVLFTLRDENGLQSKRDSKQTNNEKSGDEWASRMAKSAHGAPHANECDAWSVGPICIIVH